MFPNLLKKYPLYPWITKTTYAEFMDNQAYFYYYYSEVEFSGWK